MKPLRICKRCGLEANTEAELEQFTRSRTSKYGYSNLCKKCHREERSNQRGHRTSKLIKIFKAKSTDGILRCHFCEKEVTKLKGLDSDSLVMHSLDGDHENWDPANKVPTHHACHLRDHRLHVGKTPVKIRIDLSTREALKALGRKGESYDAVCHRLIKYWVLEEESLERGARILNLLVEEEE